MHSSPGKPTEKAGMRTPSTTSSTTANPPEPTARKSKKKAAAKKQPPDPASPAPPFPAETPDEAEAFAREALLGFFLRGAGPIAACNSAGVMLHQFFDAYDTDDEFHERLEQIRDAWGWNVAALLYQTAMGGNVTAMINWLKLRPPRDWKPNEDFADADEFIETLTGDEIVGTSLATGTPLPTEAPGMFPPPGL